MTETTIDAPSPVAVTAPATAAATFAAQRLNMVDSQVRPSDITDRRILRAMASVPREEYVPAALRAIAYMDNPVTLDPVTPARVLLEPRLFAKLVQAAAIPDGGRVLEIGCGTGYGVCVLAAMGCKVFGLEENPGLGALAQQAVTRAGAGSSEIRLGPLTAGLSAEGPFDAIIFSGAVPAVPRALFDQLKNGARLVAVVGAGPGSKATVWLRSGMTFASRDVFDAAAAPLPGFARPEQFVF